MVDAFGLIGRMLDDLVPATPPTVEEKPKRDGYSRAARMEEGEYSWR